MDKNAIREAMKARRRAVTPVARAAAGRALSERLFVSHPALGAAISKKGPIAVYIASKDEIDLTDFIRSALSFGCVLVAPRWNGTDYELVRFASLDALVAGPHGILEPPEGTVVRPKDVRAWLIPGLAFSKAGARLGYGGGWYDRLLARAKKSTPKIGVAYTFQIVDELPAEPHDIPLTDVVACEDLADMQPLLAPPQEKESFWTLKHGPDSQLADAAHRQVEARPLTWGVGLWPSPETESVAKRCAEILTEAFGCVATNLIPADTMGGIHLLDYFGDLDEVEALLQIEREFQYSIPSEKLLPDLTFGTFVDLVIAGRGTAVPQQKSRIRRVLCKVFGGSVIAAFCALPVVIPLDLFRRYIGSSGKLTGGMIIELLLLGAVICCFGDSFRHAPQRKRKAHWEQMLGERRNDSILG